MNKKKIAQFCCAALVAAGVGLNIQNAIADYGIGENSLSLVATGGSGSGSFGSSSGSSSGGPLGSYETYVIVDNEDCYEVVADKLLESREVVVKENGVEVDRYWIRKWSRKPKYKTARTTIPVKIWEVNWRPTSQVSFTETCESLNMKKCPVHLPIPDLEIRDYNY